jgi:acetate kinase
LLARHRRALAAVRAATRRLGHLEVLVDAERNDGAQHDADISHAQASVRTLVVTAREDLQIGREIRSVLVAGR